MAHATKKIIAALVLVALAATGVYVFLRGTTNAPAKSGTRSASAVRGGESVPRTVPAGQKLYHDNDFYFSLFYPQALSISTTHSGTATTIVFQSIDPVEGLQIFIVPYNSTQISDQRFKMDEPSGVRDNPVSGLIDGAQAVAFYSTDAQLGDTYEVWFIYNGFLYEVTTLKPLDTWLQGIMETWEFDS